MDICRRDNVALGFIKPVLLLCSENMVGLALVYGLIRLITIELSVQAAKRTNKIFTFAVLYATLQ